MPKQWSINEDLMNDIKEKLKLKTVDQVYRRIRTFRKAIGMANAYSVAVCAYISSIRINPHKKKYGFEPETLVKASQINTSLVQPVETKSPVPVTCTAKVNHNTTTKILSDPLLTTEKCEQAYEMAEKVYPLLFILENSIRQLIIKVMDKTYPGIDWWNAPNVVPKDVKSTVNMYKNNEQQKPWPGKKSGVSDIYYALLSHLEKIITNDNNWEPMFRSIIKDKVFIQHLIRSTNTLRNNIMHCNPISNYEIKSIKHNLSEWQRVMKEASSIVATL